MEDHMAERRINLDDEALVAASKILGIKSAEGTVNAALREVVAVQRRPKAFERLGEVRARADVADPAAVVAPPVTEAGLARARDLLRAADAKRDPLRRARLRRQISRSDAGS
jgi:Arc/MetJ family transcription regulator